MRSESFDKNLNLNSVIANQNQNDYQEINVSSYQIPFLLQGVSCQEISLRHIITKLFEHLFFLLLFT
eukprot:snap_masked-scaffold_14-processed-gene-3.41-mRNA-1 protein AED:1.00 eAED:1.00 QI:0/0/0/0/1/1/2/0/66